MRMGLEGVNHERVAWPEDLTETNYLASLTHEQTDGAKGSRSLGERELVVPTVFVLEPVAVASPTSLEAIGVAVAS